MIKKLAIITTHPIQYYAPVFRLLTERGNIAVKVFYTWGKEGAKKYDPGFGKEVEWDIPLLEGYDYQFEENSSTDPGSHHFRGIVNPNLSNNIENWGANAILIYGWSYHGHYAAMKYFWKKIPVLFRGDSNLLDEKPGWKRWMRRVALRWIYRYIDTALYVGTQNKKYFQVHGLKEKELVFAPHAIDNQRFMSPEYGVKAKARKEELGLKETDICILFAGKLESKKCPDLLLAAVQNLNEQRQHPIKLIIAGSGELEEKLKSSAAGDKNIHFLGFQNQKDMPVVYRMGDLFCLPSQGPGETWGLAVNEAMASGRAVLVSDKVGCAVDLVKEGHNGAIFRNRDLEDLIEILNGICNPVTLKRMGEYSQQEIQNWNFEQQAEAIEQAVNN